MKLFIKFISTITLISLVLITNAEAGLFTAKMTFKNTDFESVNDFHIFRGGDDANSKITSISHTTNDGTVVQGNAEGKKADIDGFSIDNKNGSNSVKIKISANLAKNADVRYSWSLDDKILERTDGGSEYKVFTTKEIKMTTTVLGESVFSWTFLNNSLDEVFTLSDLKYSFVDFASFDIDNDTPSTVFDLTDINLAPSEESNFNISTNFSNVNSLFLSGTASSQNGYSYDFTSIYLAVPEPNTNLLFTLSFMIIVLRNKYRIHNKFK